MEKRYQVFVSSTFADLQDERRKVLQTLMEMDCIPAGMEIFPAVDEEQSAFIKKIIDDCDYYLLIIGGRYGSVTEDGVSYTEVEYDYAVSKGVKVIAFLHEKPEEIAAGKSELSAELRARLEAFRAKASTGRLVRFWTRAEDLPGLVALSLSKTIKIYPAIGWVRADSVGNEDLLAQLNTLRQDNEKLRLALADVVQESYIQLTDLAGLNETFLIRGHSSSQHGRRTWTSRPSWREIFGIISPYLLKHPSGALVKSQLTDALVKREDRDGYSHQIEDQDFQTIAIQLKSLGLVKIQYLAATDNSMHLFWALTQQGEQLMLNLRTVRSSTTKTAVE